MTTWVNETTHEQKFELHTSPGQPMIKIEIKPGKEAQIPSIYDNAIRTVRDGTVVGGHAPLLTPKGQTKIPIHDAIVRAAAAGETERKLIASTGATAGGLSLDAAAQLLARNEDLERQIEAQRAEFEKRMTEFEARLQPKGGRGGAPPAQPALPGAPAQS